MTYFFWRFPCIQGEKRTGGNAQKKGQKQHQKRAKTPTAGQAETDACKHTLIMCARARVHESEIQGYMGKTD